MAGKIVINRITNANIYLDGESLMGRAEEVKLPDISAILEEHKALGMIGKIKLPAGLEALEGEIKWASLYEEVAKKTANPFKSYQLQLRSSIQRFNSQGLAEEVPLVTFLTLMFSKNPLGTFRQHQNAEFPSSFVATYCKQIIGGEEVLELDYLANIFTVNGEDILADWRANLGG